MSPQKRILLADDEAIFLKATSTMLSDNGYTCDCATDSLSATQMLESNDYDLLISDIKMPGNTDMELISNLSQIANGIPVILVTAYPSIQNSIQALRLKVDDYLLKPVDFGELLFLVNKVLANVGICRNVSLEVQQSIRKWRLDLDNIEKIMNNTSEDASFKSLNCHLDILYKMIFDSLMNLKETTQTVVRESDDRPESVNSKLRKLKNALTETVATLKRTKDTFKSKDLGLLRVKLENLLEATS